MSAKNSAERLLPDQLVRVFVKAVGILELLAAVGLILPAALDIAPVMVPVTALCWILLMVGAMVTHGRLGQFKLVMVNSIFLVLAAFIAGDTSPPEHGPSGR
ncbi:MULTISPECIES: DoxX family protein [unclassified Streptomyces]|uniref:DoxX family protein n=1 Tax=unclassified Streptomyces TaxID=2593676 RepID=UPI002E2D60AA|nr:DoxX family protein [Streptomyces sp. NBC_00272]